MKPRSGLTMLPVCWCYRGFMRRLATPAVAERTLTVMRQVSAMARSTSSSNTNVTRPYLRTDQHRAPSVTLEASARAGLRTVEGDSGWNGGQLVLS
jgi:hypothetical protein